MSASKLPVPASFQVAGAEANNWWSANEPAGALLNRLMLLFIFVPIALVFKDWTVSSLVVFSAIVPYGLLLRHLAAAAVRNHLAKYPELIEEFAEAGIIQIGARSHEA